MLGIIHPRVTMIAMIMSSTVAFGQSNSNIDELKEVLAPSKVKTDEERAQEAKLKRRFSTFPYYNYDIKYMSKQELYRRTSPEDKYTRVKKSNVFPSNSVRNYDPIERERVDGVYVGKVNAVRNNPNFTHWRYITFYHKYLTRNKVAGLIGIVEKCHDKGWRIGEWGKSDQYTTELSTKFGANMNLGSREMGMQLGLSAEVAKSITRGVQYDTRRAIQGRDGQTMHHVPYLISEEHEGSTYIQVIDSRTNKSGYIINPMVRYRSPLIPINMTTLVASAYQRFVKGYKVSKATYPKYFNLTNQNNKLDIEVENKSECSEEEYARDEQEGSDLTDAFYIHHDE